MAGSAGDRVTIDLRGIGDAVRSTAAGRGLTIAAFAREALVSALGEAPPRQELPDAPSPRLHGTVKLTWRMDVRASEAPAANARALGLSYGQYVGSWSAPRRCRRRWHSAPPIERLCRHRPIRWQCWRAKSARCCVWPARAGRRKS